MAVKSIQIWDNVLSLRGEPWIKDHTLEGQHILPGMASIEMFLEAAAQIIPHGSQQKLAKLENVIFKRTLALAEKPVTTQVLYIPKSPQGDARNQMGSIGFYSKLEGDKWQVHAEAVISLTDTMSHPPEIVPQEIPEHATCFDGEEVYKRLEDFFQLGSSFRRIRKLWRTKDDEVFALIRWDNSAAYGSYNMHPAILDSMIQTGLGYIAMFTKFDHKGVPTKLASAQIFLKGVKNFVTRSTCKIQPNGFVVDVDAFTEDGQLAASLKGRSLD